MVVLCDSRLGAWVVENVVGSGNVPLLDTKVLTVVGWWALWAYVVAFLTYVGMRRMVSRWDCKDYRTLTGTEPTPRGTENNTSSTTA